MTVVRQRGDRAGGAPTATTTRQAWPLLLAGVATIALGAGCPKPLLVSRPYPPPTAAFLGRVLSERQMMVGTLNARARATSWLGGDRVRATVLMLAERQGHLRFEAEVSLQGTVAVLATDGKQFAFLDTMKNELRRGPACPANVASLIRIPLGPADVAAILLGDARLPAESDPGRGVVDWDPAQAADVLAVRRNDGWLRFLFQGAGATTVNDAQIRIVGAVATGPDGRPRWRVAFEDFTVVPTGRAGGADGAAVTLPQTIRFAEGESGFDEGVEIKFRDRALNEPAAAEAFVLNAAPGTATIEVGCPAGTAPSSAPRLVP